MWFAGSLPRAVSGVPLPGRAAVEVTAPFAESGVFPALPELEPDAPPFEPHATAPANTKALATNLTARNVIVDPVVALGRPTADRSVTRSPRRPFLRRVCGPEPAYPLTSNQTRRPESCHESTGDSRPLWSHVRRSATETWKSEERTILQMIETAFDMLTTRPA
jgi:hypothetical protein